MSAFTASIMERQGWGVGGGVGVPPHLKTTKHFGTLELPVFIYLFFTYFRAGQGGVIESTERWGGERLQHRLRRFGVDVVSRPENDDLFSRLLRQRPVGAVPQTTDGASLFIVVVMLLVYAPFGLAGVP